MRPEPTRPCHTWPFGTPLCHARLAGTWKRIPSTFEPQVDSLLSTRVLEGTPSLIRNHLVTSGFFLTQLCDDGSFFFSRYVADPQTSGLPAQTSDVLRNRAKSRIVRHAVVRVSMLGKAIRFRITNVKMCEVPRGKRARRHKRALQFPKRRSTSYVIFSIVNHPTVGICSHVILIFWWNTGLKNS